MLIYTNKRTFLHKKRVQFKRGCLGTPTWPPFHCFGTPIWPPRRPVNGRHLIPSTKLTSSSHKTFHLSYMKFLDEMFIKVKVSSIFKEKNNSG